VLTPAAELQAAETVAAEEYAEQEMLREENAKLARLSDDLATTYVPDNLYANEAIAAGNALHRLTLAYGLYRARQNRMSRPAAPELDRRWIMFFLVCAAGGGYVLALILWTDVLVRLPEEVFAAIPPVWGIAALITGSRAVRAELAAADPASIGRHVT
jgi:hypothetical protein